MTTAKKDSTRLAVSIPEAALMLTVAEGTIRKAITAGELAAYKRPTVYRKDGAFPTQRIATRILVDDLVNWVRECWEPDGPRVVA